MASPKRILVLGTSFGGGDWSPLAAVTVGLHQAGHAVQCFGDLTIAHAFAAASIAVEVVPAEDPLGPFMARWYAAGAAGPRPELAWADACLPAVRALVREFRPELVLSQLFTMELARRTKAACGLRWCFINTESRLAAAIERVVGTARYQENATRIANHLQARDAVALARERIEALLETT